MGRFLKKLTTTFPSPSIARINDPKPLGSEKFHQRLLAGNRWHAVAQDDQLLSFAGPRWWEEFCDNLTLESGPEHIGIISYIATAVRRGKSLWQGRIDDAVEILPSL
jgi:hypothetical protein